MEDFARMLWRSGYSERFRHEVIQDAPRGYGNDVKKEREGGRPAYIPRNYDPEGMRRTRIDRKERYYRKERRGTNVREGVLIIPPTPNSILAKELKKTCANELK